MSNTQFTPVKNADIIFSAIHPNMGIFQCEMLFSENTTTEAAERERSKAAAAPDMYEALKLSLADEIQYRAVILNMATSADLTKEREDLYELAADIECRICKIKKIISKANPNK